MSTLAELVRAHADLRDGEVRHLHRLVAEWQLLADLSFADLLLWVRVRDDLLEELAGHLPDGDAGAWLSVAQARPATGPTALQDDRVGAVVTRASAPLLGQAEAAGRVLREDAPPGWSGAVPVRLEAVPVRCEGRVVAVLGRATHAGGGRTHGRLEAAYLDASAALVRMVAAGRFPFADAPDALEAGPRVGDGTVLLDPDGGVRYASPNASSALRRLGVADPTAGPLLAVLRGVDAGLPLTPTRHGTAEVEADGAVVQVRVVPLEGGPDDAPGAGAAPPPAAGALVLLRDLTDVRQRDRQLLTKDATIREIHHRVKNNLQTVAALLRLQARRTGVAEARDALQESVRRVAAIAYVHETLSTAFDETVVFDDVADRVAALVREVAPPATRVRLERDGSFGVLPAAVATPLALVLSELLQNALEHGLATSGSALVVRARREGARLRVDVDDDGAGLPAGFDTAGSTSLGLHIVRTLVEGELGGSLVLGTGPAGGTRAALDVPVPPVPGGGDGYRRGG